MLGEDCANVLHGIIAPDDCRDEDYIAEARMVGWVWSRLGAGRALRGRGRGRKQRSLLDSVLALVSWR